MKLTGRRVSAKGAEEGGCQACWGMGKKWSDGRRRVGTVAGKIQITKGLVSHFIVLGFTLSGIRSQWRVLGGEET